MEISTLCLYLSLVILLMTENKTICVSHLGALAVSLLSREEAILHFLIPIWVWGAFESDCAGIHRHGNPLRYLIRKIRHKWNSLLIVTTCMTFLFALCILQFSSIHTNCKAFIVVRAAIPMPSKWACTNQEWVHTKLISSVRISLVDWNQSENANFRVSFNRKEGFSFGALVVRNRFVMISTRLHSPVHIKAINQNSINTQAHFNQNNSSICWISRELQLLFQFDEMPRKHRFFKWRTSLAFHREFSWINWKWIIWRRGGGGGKHQQKTFTIH